MSRGDLFGILTRLIPWKEGSLTLTYLTVFGVFHHSDAGGGKKAVMAWLYAYLAIFRLDELIS